MIELYTSDTANGQKVHLMLEETSMEYSLHQVDLKSGENLQTDFLAINPLGKIPAINDRDGPGGRPLILTQSLAIILYLAEKSGRLMPSDPAHRAEALQVMALVSADLGAAFSGIYHFGVCRECWARNPRSLH